MTDENTGGVGGDDGNGDPNDDTQNAPNGDDGKPKAPTAEEVKASRRQAIEKLGLEMARGGGGNASSPAIPNDQPAAVQDNSGDELDFDLTGVDEKDARAIRATLNRAKRVQASAQTLADYGMEQARKVAAFEVAAELHDTDGDIRAEVEKALQSARTPQALDLAKRELLIKLREDASFSRASTEAAPAGKRPANVGAQATRRFDEGRGNAGNEKQSLLDEMEKIDPRDPDANKKLDALKKRVDAAQERFNKQGRR